jgi:hypothetical protein
MVLLTLLHTSSYFARNNFASLQIREKLFGEFCSPCATPVRQSRVCANLPECAFKFGVSAEKLIAV